MSPQPCSKTPSRAAAFALIELLAALVIIGVMIAVAYFWVQIAPGRTKAMMETLSHARDLHRATQTMSLDSFNAGGAGSQWTSMVDINGHAIPATVEQYFHALVKGGYLSENDLVKLVTAPGKGPGRSAPTAQNSCFKFFPVDEGGSPSDQPLMITANWSDRKLTTDPPYGEKGFVIFTKGGSGGIYRRRTDAASTDIFPTVAEHDGRVDPSMHYNYIPLK